MTEFYCDVCDKTIKSKQKKKHLNTKSHTALSMSVINRYCFNKSRTHQNRKKIKKTSINIKNV